MLLTVLVLASSASADAPSPAPPGWTVIDSHIVRSTYPFAMTAFHSIDHPGTIAIRLVGPRGKRLLGSWSVYCKAGVASESQTGTFKGTGTAMAVVHYPFRHPDNCGIGGGGRVDVLPSLTGPKFHSRRRCFSVDSPG